MKHSIVLVHIGDVFYDYINVCINQIQRFNNCDIYLIISKQHHDKIDSNINTINVDDVIKSPAHIKFLETTKLDESFRAGFWKSASERIFYVYDIVSQLNLKNVFHFENDIMVYCDLAEILDVCLQNDFNMCATFDNDKRCIPGFVYFKDADILKELNHYMLNFSDKNDMELIALFNNETKLVTSFPVVPDNYRFGLKSYFKTKKRKSYGEHFNNFGSIFDAAAIGQYLGGIDARNTNKEKTVGFVNESALYDVRDFKFKWSIDNKSRKVPFAEYRGKTIKINNLHIHSKNLSDFQ